DTVAVPLVDLDPDHEPLAVQLFVLVLDHVSVEVPPDDMEVGLAEMLTVGCSTVSVVELATPLQVRV
ncbi:MAG TPA: hypothetical protein VFB04_10930, partial [Terriglobales bacterium]|nr:hypothetical protein [Terriglobales bacterium]